MFAPLEFRETVSSSVSFAKFFEDLFSTRSFLFLGLSLEGIQDFLSRLVFRGISPRKHFALVAVSGSGWKVTADLFQRRYNIKVIDYPFTPAFEGFDSFVEALSYVARPTAAYEAFYTLSAPVQIAGTAAARLPAWLHHFERLASAATRCSRESAFFHGERTLQAPRRTEHGPDDGVSSLEGDAPSKARLPVSLSYSTTSRLASSKGLCLSIKH